MSKTRFVIAIALAAFGIAAAPAAAADVWRQPDSTINASGNLGLAPGGKPNVGHSSLADVGGVPHVAWSEWDGTAFQVRVARLESGEWKPVGGSLNADPTHHATKPRLAVHGATLWITWLEEDDWAARIVHVARRVGGAWEPVGGGAVDVFPNSPRYSGGQFAAGQAQVVFHDGTAYLGIMEDQGSDYDLAFRKLANDTWVAAPMGTRPPGSVIPRGFELIPSGGQLYLTWWDLQGADHLWRLAPAGGTIEDLDYPEADEFAGLQAADVAGTLHILRGGFVYRRLSTSWTQAAPALERSGRLLAIGEALHVLTTDASGRLQVLRFTPGDVPEVWQTVGGGPLTDASTFTATGFAAVGSTPYVSWAEPDGGHYELRVARAEAEAPPAGPANPGVEPPKGEGAPAPPPPAPAPPAPGPCGVRIAGTQGPDSLTGDGLRNTIHGGRGNDRIFGLGGADCLFGGAGNDLLKGGTGVDRLSGGAGNDRIVSGAGNDRVSAGSGNDVVDSRGRGYDTVDCGPGRDRALVGDLDRVRNCERVVNVD